ncbi:hypothetical protein BDZ91DRAFT_751969 [Kalaharituber pfeilii]|nr:hypothetical protein BDZ91DRAFT_751969 [Kalaharituber pfeilii]
MAEDGANTDPADAQPSKKHKKGKRHRAATSNENDTTEQEAPPSSSTAKKKKKKEQAVAAESEPEVLVEATQQQEAPAPSPPPTASDAAPAPSQDVPEEDTTSITKKRKGKGKRSEKAPPEEPEPMQTQVESVPATQPEQSADQTLEEPAEPPAREATPPPTAAAPAATSESPVVTHTPRPKSKVAIAYERKRKRLEAAAAAASQTPAGNTTGDASLEMDMPNEEDEYDNAAITETAASAATPKSAKRKKRRLPDVAPAAETSSPATGSTRKKRRLPDLNATPLRAASLSDSEMEAHSDAAPQTSTRAPARTPRTPKQKSGTGSAKRARSEPAYAAAPQPGTTAVARKRPSYTYAPDPAPATPPSTGTFTQPECEIIDNYLANFAAINGLDNKQLIARIWGDLSVVPDQSKQARESFWKDLYELFPHRKRLAIYNHVRRRYHNFSVQGAKWTEEQDQELNRLVMERGKKWTLIGREMGRLPDDCRDRWRNYVKCGGFRREKEWTEEEEEKLREVVMECKEELAKHRADGTPAQDVEVNWTMVSEKMGGWRSRIQCRYKWSKMLEWEQRGGTEGWKAGKRKSMFRRGSTAADGDENGTEEGHKKRRRKSTTRATQGKGRRSRHSAISAEVVESETEEVPPAQEVDTTPVDPALLAADAAAAAPSASTTVLDDPAFTPLAAKQMKTGDVIWLLRAILSFRPPTPGDIPWSAIAAQAPHRHWTPAGLERAFGKIVKKGIPKKERDGLGVVEGVERLLGELAELPEEVRGEKYVPPAGGDEHLRQSVRYAMDQIKEREETEKLARVLLSQVQEAYGN